MMRNGGWFGTGKRNLAIAPILHILLAVHQVYVVRVVSRQVRLLLATLRPTVYLLLLRSHADNDQHRAVSYLRHKHSHTHAHVLAIFFRYLAIAYPMRSVWLSSIGRAKKVIALIWLTSAVLAIPTALRMVSHCETGDR